jgi:predicted site-specific integrase-resolvase
MTTERGRWITTVEAGQILAVDFKTIARWHDEGRLARNGIRVQRTIGGHRRLFEPDVRAAAAKLTHTAEEPEDD